jgi:carbonic anhydrase
LDSDIFPEIVQWVVSDEKVSFSPAQINAFKALFPEKVGNSREVQNIAGRKATYTGKLD